MQELRTKAGHGMERDGQQTHRTRTIAAAIRPIGSRERRSGAKQNGNATHGPEHRQHLRSNRTDPILPQRTSSTTAQPSSSSSVSSLSELVECNGHPLDDVTAATLSREQNIPSGTGESSSRMRDRAGPTTTSGRQADQEVPGSAPTHEESTAAQQVPDRHDLDSDQDDEKVYEFDEAGSLPMTRWVQPPRTLERVVFQIRCLGELIENHVFYHYVLFDRDIPSYPLLRNLANDRSESLFSFFRLKYLDRLFDAPGTAHTFAREERILDLQHMVPKFAVYLMQGREDYPLPIERALFEKCDLVSTSPMRGYETLTIHVTLLSFFRRGQNFQEERRSLVRARQTLQTRRQQLEEDLRDLLLRGVDEPPPTP